MFDLYQLRPEQDIPIYQQLVDVIVTHVKNGSLPHDTRLPTVRDLAAQLNVARGTVKRAYDELEQRGVITKVQGRGTFVCYQPASSGSAKEQAMAAIDRMLDTLEELNLSQTEIQIFLDLKLRERDFRREDLKIAVVECNPEALSQVTDQLRAAVEPAELYGHLLREVKAYPYRIGEDMDLIITSAEHADEIRDLISQKEKIARVALRLAPESVSGIIKLTPGQTVGILCGSPRFGELIGGVIRAYTEDVTVLPPCLMEEADPAALDSLSAVAVPEGYERRCPNALQQKLREFGLRHPVIRCRYQVDEGSMMYLTERIERLREKRRG